MSYKVPGWRPELSEPETSAGWCEVSNSQHQVPGISEPEPDCSQFISLHTTATTEVIEFIDEIEMEIDITIAPDNNKVKVGVGGLKTTSLDICQPKHHHAPLERQMCLQLPEERPFLRRCIL